MNEIFILHIKTFDGKQVCFRPLADWLVRNNQFAVEGDGRSVPVQAVPGRWWVANSAGGEAYDRSDGKNRFIHVGPIA